MDDLHGEEDQSSCHGDEGGEEKPAARRRGEPGHQAAERDADERRPGQGEPEGLNLAEQRKEGSCEHDQQAGDCGEAEKIRPGIFPAILWVKGMAPRGSQVTDCHRESDGRVAGFPGLRVARK